jgi:hypothetical protein
MKTELQKFIVVGVSLFYPMKSDLFCRSNIIYLLYCVNEIPFFVRPKIFQDHIARVLDSISVSVLSPL